MENTRRAWLLAAGSLVLAPASGQKTMAIDPKRVFSDPLVVALADAAQRGDIADMRRTIGAGANVNAVGDIRGGKKMTPLVFAVLAPTPEPLRTLLAAGAKANVVFEGNTSPLFFAAAKKDPTYAGLLLKAGADPNGAAPSGSILGQAMINERDAVVGVLLQAGADPNGTHDGDSLLENAIGWEKLEYIPPLMEAGARWSDALGKSFCVYTKTAARTLDRQSAFFAKYQRAWDYLQAKGVRLPCERVM